MPVDVSPESAQVFLVAILQRDKNTDVKPLEGSDLSLTNDVNFGASTLLSKYNCSLNFFLIFSSTIILHTSFDFGLFVNIMDKCNFVNRFCYVYI
jgi:hypothetical protein